MSHFVCLPAGLSRWYRFRELASNSPDLRSDAWAVWMFLLVSAADDDTSGSLVFPRDLDAIMEPDRASAAIAALIAHGMAEECDGAVRLSEGDGPILLTEEDVYCCAVQS
jgi:hypothetical protein